MADADLNLDLILEATLNALLRSTTDIQSGDRLIEDYGPDDVAQSVKDTLREEIEAFVEEYGDDLSEALAPGTGYTEDHIGQDIALTRNRHGAGFWDRGLGSVGTRLTVGAHNLGSFDLYPTPDGSVQGG